MYLLYLFLEDDVKYCFPRIPGKEYYWHLLHKTDKYFTLKISWITPEKKIWKKAKYEII